MISDIRFNETWAVMHLLLIVHGQGEKATLQSLNQLTTLTLFCVTALKKTIYMYLLPFAFRRTFCKARHFIHFFFIKKQKMKQLSLSGIWSRQITFWIKVNRPIMSVSHNAPWFVPITTTSRWPLQLGKVTICENH